MAIINVNSKEELVKLLEGNKKVLVDFWASWCGPCRMLGQVLHEIDEEDHDFVIAKVNVDENMDLAREFNISSIPHMFVYTDGKVTNDILGYVAKQQVLEALK